MPELLIDGVRTQLSPVPMSRSGLQCPVCDLYTTKAPYSSALKQLSCHVAKAHPRFEWTHRYCNGPRHDEPTLLPLSGFYKHGRRNDWRAHCKECDQHVRAQRLGRPNSGLVPAAKVKPLAEELVTRAGSYAQASRESGVALGALYNLRNGKNRGVTKTTVARILVARSRLRRNRPVGIA